MDTTIEAGYLDNPNEQEQTVCAWCGRTLLDHHKDILQYCRSNHEAHSMLEDLVVKIRIDAFLERDVVISEIEGACRALVTTYANTLAPKPPPYIRHKNR